MDDDPLADLPDDPLAGYPVDAPSLRGPVLFDQFWADAAFVHWPVDPDEVAPLLPAGVRPDVWDGGASYVGLVAFRMAGAGFGTTRHVPYFGTFAETNVRLYSVDDAGRHGVVFRSLDSERAVMVPFARAAVGAPYTWSAMRVGRRGDEVRYALRRRLPRRGLRSRLAVRVGDRAEPDPLQVWLTARWGLHSTWLGRSLWVPNRHEAWPLHRAEVLHLDDDLVAAAGVRPAGPMLPALFSPGVHAQFGPPRVVRPAG